jgi:transcriptional regulator with XRE-family HTH domain
MAGERALITPDLLRWAREQTGLGLEAAARKIGTKGPRLEAWETGQSLPSNRQARAAARVYHRPRALYYLSRLPAPDRLPHDFRRLSVEDAPAQSPDLR